MEKFLAAKLAQVISEMVPNVAQILKSEGIDVSAEILLSAFDRVASTEPSTNVAQPSSSKPQTDEYPIVLSTKKRGRAAKPKAEGSAKPKAKSKGDGTPCQAMTKGGNPCKRNAPAGKKYCTMHEKVYGRESATGGIDMVPKNSFMTAPPQKAKSDTPMPAVDPIAVPEMDDSPETEESDGELD